MSWVRIDDDLPHHPKMVKAGPMGLALYIAGLCYAGHYLTDGTIPSDVLPSLIPGLPEPNTDSLVAAGLWKETENGYQIHDYRDYQPSRNQVLASRRADRKRKQGPRPSGRIPGGIQSDSQGNPSVTSHVPPIDKEHREEEQEGGSASEPAPVLPEWYKILQEIPGFKTPVKRATEWLAGKAISEARAEETALSLKAKWGGKGWKYTDPWATFKNWVIRPPFQGGRSGPLPGADSFAAMNERHNP